MTKSIEKRKDQIKTRIPYCEWLDEPSRWDRQAFIKQTADYLWVKAEIGSNQDAHLLGALGVQMEIFVKCWDHIQKNGLIQEFRNETIGQNTHLAIGDKALARAVILMNEIGLTKDFRAKEIVADEKDWTEFLKGPK